MNKILRNVPAIVAVLGVLMMFGHGWLVSEFAVSRPKQPDASKGWTFPVENRGVYYVSANEKTIETALLYGSISLLCLAAGTAIVTIVFSKIWRKRTDSN